jgi:hypothetical protein
MFVAGKAILVLLALVLTLATPPSDFNRRHVCHPAWPGHARFHCAAHALLNMGIGALSLWLLFTARPGEPFAIVVAALLLGWSGLSLFLAALFPGVSSVADGEKVWRRLPISLWGTVVYLALVAGGAALMLSA